MSMTLMQSDGVLVLNEVNKDVGEFSVLTVNEKGLVVAARNLTLQDIETAIGYTPYDGQTNPRDFVSVSDFPVATDVDGWTQLPNGLILQWGRASFTGVPDSGTESDSDPSFTSYVSLQADPVVFPMAFPHAMLSCTATGCNDDTYMEGAEMQVGIKSYSTTGVQFVVGRVTGSNSSAPTSVGETGLIMWMALGF